MNTKVEYLYRDASNWKQFGECVVSGSVTLNEIKQFLHDGKFFIPAELGLKNLFPVPFGNDDHVWHEICFVEPTNEPPTVSFDSKELIRRFQESAENEWNEYKWTECGYGGTVTIGFTHERRTMKSTEKFMNICGDVEMTIGFIKVLYDRLKQRNDPRSKMILDELHLRIFEATTELVNIPEQFLPQPDVKKLLVCFVGGLEDAKRLCSGSDSDSVYFRQLLLMKKRLGKIARHFENQCEQ